MTEAIIGLIGVIVGAFITTAGNAWSERHARRKKGEYLAIRVACILDRFVEGCTEVVGDNGLSYGQRDAQGCLSPQVPYPQFSPLFDDVDWKALPAELMYEVLSFPNYIESANEMISSVFDYVAFPPDFDEGFEERKSQYSQLGVNAYRLAEKLRKAYKLPGRDFGGWNPIEYLERSLSEVNELRERRAQEQAKLHEELRQETDEERDK